ARRVIILKGEKTMRATKTGNCSTARDRTEDQELSHVGNCARRLLLTVCLPNPDLGLLQTHTPAPFPEFPGQLRIILPCQFIQPRNVQCLERQSISNPHSLALTQGNDSPHSLIKLRIYFRWPFVQSEELICLSGVSLPQRVYSCLPEFPHKALVPR